MDTQEMPWVPIREPQPANFLWIFVWGEPEPALIDQMTQATVEYDVLDWAIVPLRVPKETP